jgi:heme-degrading monooxygenase HmoA
MYARITTLMGSPAKIDDGIRSMREETLPAVSKIPGFVGAIEFVDRMSGKTIVATLWETEQARQASEEQANKLRASASTAAGATSTPTIERYEVALMSGIEVPARA